MQSRSCLVGLAVLAFAGCASPTAPNVSLNGTWAHAVTTPAGGGISLSLNTIGNRVTGTGQVCYVGGNCYPGQVTVSGTNAASFELSLTDGRSWSATYVGTALSQYQLRGTWSDPMGSSTILLTRSGVL